MAMHDHFTQPKTDPSQLQLLLKKLNAVLFYVITSVVVALLLFLSLILAGNPFDWPSYLAEHQAVIWRIRIIGVASAAMNISFLTLSTLMFIRAFRKKLWLGEQVWERYWNILINALLLLIFGGCFVVIALGAILGIIIR
jgi:hypothetical protein